MAFEGLAERLQGTIQKIKGKGKVSEADVKEMMREVRFALIEADVNLKVVKEFVKKVSERAIGVDVMESLTPGQQVVKIVKDELTELMGGDQSKIEFSSKQPTVIMMVGLQGAGKTTTSGKLASLLRKKKQPQAAIGGSRRLPSGRYPAARNNRQAIVAAGLLERHGYFPCGNCSAGDRVRQTGTYGHGHHRYGRPFACR